MTEIEKHEKAIRILEMIKDLDKRSENHKRDIHKYSFYEFKTICNHYTNRVEIDTKIKNRLTNYYNQNFKL